MSTLIEFLRSYNGPYLERNGDYITIINRNKLCEIWCHNKGVECHHSLSNNLPYLVKSSKLDRIGKNQFKILDCSKYEKYNHGSKRKRSTDSEDEPIDDRECKMSRLEIEELCISNNDRVRGLQLHTEILEGTIKKMADKINQLNECIDKIVESHKLLSDRCCLLEKMFDNELCSGSAPKSHPVK